MIRVDRAICKLEKGETAGQERFSTITASYYRGAQGAILVYDFSKRESHLNMSRLGMIGLNSWEEKTLKRCW
jgi:GTPase SAR1 family protein